MKHRTHAQQGFSLIDVSVLVAVLGLLASTVLTVNTTRKENKGYQKTIVELQDADTAIRLFFKQNKRLPCPASFTALPLAVEFAQEPVGAIACGGGTSPTILLHGMFETARTGSAPRIRIGALPTRAIGLPDSHALDGWGSRYYYAVIEDLATTPALFNSFTVPVVADEPIVILSDPGGAGIRAFAYTPNNTTAYVVFSVGNDRQGGYSKTGAYTIACAAIDWDSENCDLDFAFVDAIINDTADAARYHDFLRYGRLGDFRK